MCVHSTGQCHCSRPNKKNNLSQPSLEYFRVLMLRGERQRRKKKSRAERRSLFGCVVCVRCDDKSRIQNESPLSIWIYDMMITIGVPSTRKRHSPASVIDYHRGRTYRDR